MPYHGNRNPPTGTNQQSMSIGRKPASNKQAKVVRGEKGLIRFTSLDAGHLHEYTVDTAGNGAALEYQSPTEPRIVHTHEVINWVVQPAQSNCYPNCREVYGQDGIESHIHTIEDKSTLNKQVGVFANMLPSVYIDRVALEPSGNPSLKVTVDFCIREKIKNNFINEWIGDPILKKNLKIKLIQSTSPELTSSLSRNINIENTDNENIKIISNITIDDVIGGADNFIENNSYTDDEENSIVSLYFRKTFSVDTNVGHLSYFVLAYLEADNSRPQNGYISLERIIDNGGNIGSAVQDFRIFNTVKSLPVELASSDKEKSLIERKNHALSKDSMIPSRKEPYFSDIFLTRDRLNRAKFAFAIDYSKIIKDSSIFGNLYNNNTNILSFSSIVAMTLKRRRVVKSNTNNKLGSPLSGEKVFSDYTSPTTILTTKGSHESIEQVSDTTSGVREAGLSSKNGEGIRFFVGYDNSISRLSDGIYQYGIELSVEDKAKEYLEGRLNILSDDRKRLHEYYVEGSKTGVTKYDLHLDTSMEQSAEILNSSGNYNSNSNKYTQKFINRQRANFASWKIPVINYLNMLRELTNYGDLSIESKMIDMTNPETASPKSVLAVIESMDNLISKIDYIVNAGKVSAGKNNSNREARTYTGSGVNKIIKFEYWFTNDEFDASLRNNFGYDYLSNNANEVLANTGIKLFSVLNYNKRVAKEISNYYTNISNGATSTNWTFLAPSLCYFSSSEKSKIFDFSSITDYEKYANLSANILAHNSDTPSGELDLTEDKLKSTMSSLYSNISLVVKTAGGDDITKPTEPIGENYLEPNIKPNKLYLALMKSYSKSGLTNSSSTDNPFTKSANSFKVGDQVINPDEKGIELWKMENVNFIKSHVPPAAEVLNNPPIQIKSLMENLDNWTNGDPIKNSDISPYFHFKYSMINRIEVLTSFKGSSDARIKGLEWQPLTRVTLGLRNNNNPNKVLLCRLKPFELPIMGIKQPKGLQLPIYDSYFILEVET